MTRPLVSVARVETRAGTLDLRRRGSDFLLQLDGRVLMNSHADRSERTLAEAVCGRLTGPSPRVLIAGLGMGITLRAALEVLPAAAWVQVAELEPALVEWCGGPLRAVCNGALEDPRVAVRLEDVRDAIRRAGEGGQRFDAIALDLSAGPPPAGLRGDPLYGPGPTARAAAALTPGGVLGVWGEQRSPAFERVLARAGFNHERLRPRGARRHVIYLAERARREGRSRGK